MAEIRVENLHKAFADFVAVKDSTFTVEDGEFFCLLGPSGCGKTTTLRMIAGLELPTRGQIFLGGEDVTWQRASCRSLACSTIRCRRFRPVIDSGSRSAARSCASRSPS